MRNPNGYGSVVKLSGNRRNPYMVRKTDGYNEKGHPKYVAIGYTRTREEGLYMLANYNNAPWDVEADKITLKELYKLFCERKLPKLGESNQSGIKASYNHISKLENMAYKNIKAFHMQETIDGCNLSYATQMNIKNLWLKLDKMAMELDIINKKNSQLVTTAPRPETTRTRFTDEELYKIWELYLDYKEGKEIHGIPLEILDTVLMLIYTGFRITEFASLKTEDISLGIGTLKGGIKTKAGKDRVIPIHSAIRHIVEGRYNQKNEYFVGCDNPKRYPVKYREKWKIIMNYLGIDKTPHESRHTLESVLDSVGANKKCIDLIMGHTSKDIGNRVYNHKTIDELKTEMEKFSFKGYDKIRVRLLKLSLL